MIPQEVYKMYNILCSFLGDSKSGLDESYQLQFSCPRCIKEKGEQERNKFNLEVSLSKNVYNCWSCSASGDHMQGNLYTLIRRYGNETLLKEYKQAVSDIRTNKLYSLEFSSGEFDINTGDTSIFDEIKLPKGYKELSGSTATYKEARNYLYNRGITDDIITEFHLGIIPFSKEDKMMSNRIVLPSFSENGFLNYWTARDFIGEKWRPKYKNPQVNRKDIIFNENNIDWDSDITLVEGPFDAIVFPNMIPLLGKKITNEFKLYQSLMSRAKANVNIFLDGDAYPAAKDLYKLLNKDELYGRVRYIPTTGDEDPSQIFQDRGRDGIIETLSKATKLREIYL